MTAFLPDTAPGLDQPIAVLKHCHDRIRKQLGTLRNLLAHLPNAGADLEAQQAAAAVLRYFNQAAPHHHADEEVDLLPMLQATARGADADLLADLVPQILAQHERMHNDWHAIEVQLEAIASGASDRLSGAAVTAFSDAYSAHMEQEETHIAPMAKRLFSAGQMASLGQAMRIRRGINE
jgi:pyridoxamine 5'-phosphate oxidase